jgi:cell division protein FtsB
MSNVNAVRVSLFQLQDEYEELLEEEGELDCHVRDLKDEIDDLSIPESCGGAGGSTYANLCRNQLVEQHNRLLGSLNRVREKRYKVEELIEQLEDSDWQD